MEISELIARCAPPRNKYAKSSSNKSSNSIRLETDGLEFQQTKSSGSDSFVHEYCPAPSFSLGIDDFVPETAVEAVVCDGPSILADPEFIQTFDDSEECELGGVNEACQLPKQRSNESLGARAEGSRSPTVLSTPEKTAEQVEDGSGSKNYTSSSSGEPVPNKFERRIIKPSPCIRSPFTDYNEKKMFHRKPDVNRLYSSVILHGRSNEEVSPGVDTRYNVLPN